MHRIVLASESPYRKAQLTGLGLSFDTKKPLIDEEKEKVGFDTPASMALGLAKLKALSLQAPGQIVIGGDQLIDLNGIILGKPHNRERAISQLMEMQNRTHRILTALAVVTPDEVFEHLDITTLQMKKLTQGEIEKYIDLDLPLDCAGSYKIEKNGKHLFAKIESQDSSSIVGLPLLKLTEILQNLGYEIKK